jgi:dihydrofolate reductase
MAAAWPDRAGDPFADQMNSVRKYVVSTSLTSSDVSLWENSKLLPSEDVGGSVASLREMDGGDIVVWGSSQLVRYLARKNLIDEYRLMIEPILLGGGKRIFPEDGIARTLTLQNVKTASTGVLVVSYSPD